MTKVACASKLCFNCVWSLSKFSLPNLLLLQMIGYRMQNYKLSSKLEHGQNRGGISELLYAPDVNFD